MPDMASAAGASFGLGVNAPLTVATRKRGAAASNSGAASPVATLPSGLTPSRRAAQPDVRRTARSPVVIVRITRRMVDPQLDNLRPWTTPRRVGDQVYHRLTRGIS